jgi:hypothetical protein
VSPLQEPKVHAPEAVAALKEAPPPIIGTGVNGNGHVGHAARPLPPATARADDAGDVWPHTYRVLPWLVATFLTMLWLVPFDSITAPIDLGFDSKLDRLVLVIMAAVWLVLAAAGGRYGPRFRRTPFNVAFLFFITVAIASDAIRIPVLANLGEDQLAGKKLALLLAYVLFFYFVATAVRPREVPNFLKFMVILAAITAIGSVYEYRTHTNLFYDWAPKIFQGFHVGVQPGLSKFGRPPIVGPTKAALADATILSIALPFALVFMFNAKQRREKLFWYAATGLVLAGTCATLRRSAVLIPAGALLALLLYSPKRMLRFLPALAVLVLCIQVIAPHAISGIRYQFQNENNQSTEGRKSDYGAVTPDILTYPAFGRGYGTYDPHKYRILDNAYLLLLVETGFVGLAAFAITLVTGGVIAHKTIRTRDPVRGPPALALMAAIVGFAIACFTFDALSFPQAPYMLLFTLALVVVAGDRGLAPTPRRQVLAR